ncbi:MAG: DUF1656 domain-containing protein [Terrimicrobiaceae bacterium]|nr:DUF1656 domain-containing protein [Terrimicrobiaceae bacterium]
MADLLNAEIDFLGTYVPWWLVIGVIAYLAAWLCVRLLEHARLTRHIWHLPLFFLALVVLFYSAVGLALAP